MLTLRCRKNKFSLLSSDKAGSTLLNLSKQMSEHQKGPLTAYEELCSSTTNNKATENLLAGLALPAKKSDDRKKVSRMEEMATKICTKSACYDISTENIEAADDWGTGFVDTIAKYASLINWRDIAVFWVWGIWTLVSFPIGAF